MMGTLATLMKRYIAIFTYPDIYMFLACNELFQNYQFLD